MADDEDRLSDLKFVERSDQRGAVLVRGVAGHGTR